jgi:putative addiction module component (TIGR02574 family)
MSMAVDKLKPVLAELSVEERSELARFLVDSIDVDECTDVDAAWDHELARRADGIHRGEASGKPADVVIAELRPDPATC